MGAFTFEPLQRSALFIIQLAANPLESSRPCSLYCKPDLTPQPTNRRCVHFLFLKASFFSPLLRMSGLFHTMRKITSVSPDLDSISVPAYRRREGLIVGWTLFSTWGLVSSHTITKAKMFIFMLVIWKTLFLPRSRPWMMPVNIRRLKSDLLVLGEHLFLVLFSN